ncbi:hypothetical protein IKG41_00410 [Candidatus Saccharibacteria bacterium]|nr:hypothetical protein [Candidatus Saccharibacteria bacterium]
MKLFAGEKIEKNKDNDPYGYDKVFSVPDDLQPKLDSGEEMSEKSVENMYNHIIEMEDAIKNIAEGTRKQDYPFDGYTHAYNVDYMHKMEARKRAIEINYTVSLLPEQNKEKFVEWANKPESEFDFDITVKGIFAQKLGAPEDMIKDSIVSLDRGLGEEGNQKMGEVVYDRMLGFLNEGDKKED